MKLSEKSKVVIEWVIAIIMAAVCFDFYVLRYKSFTPLKAFRDSERTLNYGPSEIVKELDTDGIKIYLGKYKDWISAQAIKTNLITWSHLGGNVTGVPIKYDEKVAYSWSGSSVKNNKFLWIAYGFVNDASISKITLQVKTGDKQDSMEYLLDKDKMFIFSWFDDNPNRSTISKIIGTDKDNNVIYEYKYPGS